MSPGLTKRMKSSLSASDECPESSGFADDNSVLSGDSSKTPDGYGLNVCPVFHCLVLPMPFRGDDGCRHVEVGPAAGAIRRRTCRGPCRGMLASCHCPGGLSLSVNPPWHASTSPLPALRSRYLVSARRGLPVQRCTANSLLAANVASIGADGGVALRAGGFPPCPCLYVGDSAGPYWQDSRDEASPWRPRYRQNARTRLTESRFTEHDRRAIFRRILWCHHTSTSSR